MIDQILSDEQQLPNNGSAFSTNTIDLGALTEQYSAVTGANTAMNQFGPADGKIRIVASIGATAVTGATSLKVALYDCETEAGTYKATDIASPVITVGSALAAGTTVLDVPLPRRVKRYIKLQYTTVGNPTGGTINASTQYGSRTENKPLFRA